jgi:hypothetical protein
VPEGSRYVSIAFGNTQMNGIYRPDGNWTNPYFETADYARFFDLTKPRSRKLRTSLKMIVGDL